MIIADIPIKEAKQEETFNHQVRLSESKTIKFARVREILGGYTTSELLEIMIDQVIEKYYDGKTPDQKYLPKGVNL